MKKTPQPRNALEKRVQEHLGEPWEYEAITLSYTLKKRYTPDFIDRDAKIIRETKGYFPAVDRAKMKAVKEQHSDWRVIMVFQDETKKISKKSETTYADWCDQNKIEWEKAPAPIKKVKPCQSGTKNTSKRSVKKPTGSPGKRK